MQSAITAAESNSVPSQSKTIKEYLFLEFKSLKIRVVSQFEFPDSARSGHSPTTALFTNPGTSLDYPVGTQQDGLRDHQTERFRGLEVHNEFIPRGIFERQRLGLRPLQHLVHEGCRARSVL